MSTDVVGKTDVTIIPPGPGAWRQPAHPDATYRDWDAADASLLIGDLGEDGERTSIAEISISALPYASDGDAVDVSIELTAEDVSALIGALRAIQQAHRR